MPLCRTYNTHTQILYFQFQLLTIFSILKQSKTQLYHTKHTWYIGTEGACVASDLIDNKELNWNED